MARQPARRRARKRRTRITARTTRPRRTARPQPKKRRRIGRIAIRAPHGGLVTVMTEAQIAWAHREYEDGDMTNAAIAAELGISERAFDRLRASQGWRPRRMAVPEHLKEAARLHAQALRVGAEAADEPVSRAQRSTPSLPSPAGGGGSGRGTWCAADPGSPQPLSESLAVPDLRCTATGSPPRQRDGDPARCSACGTQGEAPTDSPPPSAIELVEQAVLERLADLRDARAQLRATPANSPAWRHSAATLDLLARTLERLAELRRKQQTPVQASYDDDMPADLDAFLVDGARRIDAFVASRTDPGDAASAAPAESGEAD